jgi:hypothetical protein
MFQHGPFMSLSQIFLTDRYEWLISAALNKWGRKEEWLSISLYPEQEFQEKFNNYRDWELYSDRTRNIRKIWYYCDFQGLQGSFRDRTLHDHDLHILQKYVMYERRILSPGFMGNEHIKVPTMGLFKYLRRA